MSTQLKLTPTESVEVRSATPDALEVEVTYGASGKTPPKHFHPDQDEHFEVLAGTLRVRVDGEERTLATGETIEIPRGAVHQMWNPTEEATRALWRTSPAGRTEDWFRAIDSCYPAGVLAFAVLLGEYRDVFRLAGPDFLLRPALGVLAVVGRARGYSATGAGS